MYLGSPRMAEMVIGEKVTLEEMGGARMHTSKSGCGDVLVSSDEEGIEFVRDIYDPPYGGREFGIRDPNETNLIPFGQQALDYFLRGERLGLEGSCFRFIAMSRASSAFWTTLRAIVDKGFAPAFFTKYSSAWWSRSRVWDIRSGA